MTKKIYKYLGIDWGERRIGLALADSETKLATPYKVVAGLKEVLQVAADEAVDRLVIGQPLKLSGAADNLTASFEEFVRKLKISTNLAVELSDERLSSRAADALSGGKKTKAPRDAVAAMLILQSYLDSL